jgi:acyl-CoA thioesterase
MTANGLLPDVYAEHLGAVVSRLGDGAATARLEIGAEHLNPHGTAHGAVVYAVAAVALATAANDENRSGVARTVVVDHLAPARVGDLLVATARVVETTASEDLFEVRVLREADGTVVARVGARVTRRSRG